MNNVIINDDRETPKGGNDTVEGIAFSRDSAVIMTGVFIEEKEVRGGADDILFCDQFFCWWVGYSIWIGQFVHYKDARISLQNKLI